VLELADRLTPAQREGRQNLVGPPPPDARAQELLAERVAALATAAGRAAVVASACEDADLGFVRRALERAGLSLEDLLAAEERDLVQLGSGRLEWRHPLIRSVAYHRSTAELRRAAHGAVGAALTPGDSRRPWHLAAAATEPDEEVAAALEQEADGLRLRGGYAASGRARARAADMTPDRTRRVARLLDANGDFEFAGRFDEARRMLERARELTEDPLARARIRGLEASLVLRQGRPLEAREILAPQARLLADHAPVAAARFHLQAAFASMGLVEVGPWVEHARAALTLVRNGDRSTRGVAGAMLASALVAATRLDVAEPLLEETERSVLDRGEDDPVGGAVEMYALMARSLLWIERWDAAERILRRLEQDARRLSTGGGLPYVLNVRALLDMRLGRWSRAEAAATEAASLARDVGDEIFFLAGSAVRSWVAALDGRAEECRAAVQDALGSPEFVGLPRAVANYSPTSTSPPGRSTGRARLGRCPPMPDEGTVRPRRDYRSGAASARAMAR
jgi:tetratricopeptide (TPR) repeat protein